MRDSTVAEPSALGVRCIRCLPPDVSQMGFWRDGHENIVGVDFAGQTKASQQRKKLVALAARRQHQGHRPQVPPGGLVFGPDA